MIKTGVIKERYFYLFFLSSLLLASWVFSPTRVFWNFIDEKAYFFFNSFLAFRPFAILVGVLSQPLTDFAFDIVMVLLFIRMLKFVKPGKVISYLLATFLYELSTFYFINKKLIAKYLDYDRLSPSLILKGGINILDQISFGGVKVYAHHSFPGDHATTFFLWAFFMWVVGGRQFGRVAMGLAIFFSIPRIIVGAHWFTDVFIGGFFVAALLLVLAIWSRLFEAIVGWVSWVQRKLSIKILAKPRKEDSLRLK